MEQQEHLGSAVHSRAHWLSISIASRYRPFYIPVPAGLIWSVQKCVRIIARSNYFSNCATLLRFRMPLKCQNRLFERQSTPGYFKCKRQIGFYFPKTDDFRAVSENKNRFENRYEHPGGVLPFKCVSTRVCETSALILFIFIFIVYPGVCYRGFGWKHAAGGVSQYSVTSSSAPQTRNFVPIRTNCKNICMHVK